MRNAKWTKIHQIISATPSPLPSISYVLQYLSPFETSQVHIYFIYQTFLSIERRDESSPYSLISKSKSIRSLESIRPWTCVWELRQLRFIILCSMIWDYPIISFSISRIKTCSSNLAQESYSLLHSRSFIMNIWIRN